MTGKAKLNRKQEAAIAALLTASTIAEAAAAVGVHEQTVWRWMQLPDFKEAYRDAKRKAVDQAISRLQQVSGEAVETLRTVMKDSDAPPSSRVSAAKAVIDVALKAVEMDEMAARIEALEEAVGGMS